MKKPKSIVIIGKRWFDRINGNTYHSVIALADGKQVVNVRFCYGYGDHYIQTATEQLEKAGYLPNMDKYENGGSESLWQYCERKKINYSYSVSDVARKRDL